MVLRRGQRWSFLRRRQRQQLLTADGVAQPSSATGQTKRFRGPGIAGDDLPATDTRLAKGRATRRHGA